MGIGQTDCSVTVQIDVLGWGLVETLRNKAHLERLRNYVTGAAHAGFSAADIADDLLEDAQGVFTTVDVVIAKKQTDQIHVAVCAVAGTFAVSGADGQSESEFHAQRLSA